jgi:protein-disulfide isomerase
MLPAMAAAGDIDKNKTVGDPAAPVTIQLFSDFECPVCKLFHDQTLPSLMKDYVFTGKVYLVYRDFPLNIHKYSRVAAGYATAAAQVGLYQSVADALFRDQAAWTANGKVWDSAASVLTPAQRTKVKALADTASVFGEIQRDLDAGAAASVNSTPTLVISRGDKRYPVSGTLNYLLVKRLIDDLAK